MKPYREIRSLVVAVSVAGAGVIHLAAVRSHIGSSAAVASFIGIGLVQILLGGSFLFSGGARLKRIALLGVGALAIGAWSVSRTWGLPAVSGHSGPEPAGAADVAAVALQLVAVLLLLLPARAVVARARIAATLIVLPALAVSAIASFSLLSVPPHAHGAEGRAQQPRTAYVDRPNVIGPSVPISATTPIESAPAPAGHLDAPGGPSHSH